MAQGTFSNNTPSVSRPTEPAIGTATTSGGTTNVTVTFTPSTIGAPATSYIVTGVPASTAAVTTTLTTTASPATLTGQSANTTYSYTVRPQNFYGLGSRSSSAATSGTIPTVYELTQTFNSSGTFTMPTGKTLMAAIVRGGGGPGLQGGVTGSNPNYNGSGGAGGAGAGTTGFVDYSLAAGSTATITIGAAQGISKITVSAVDIATANGATQDTPGNASSNVAGAQNIVGVGGGTGGTGAGGAVTAGSAGSSATNVTFNAAGFPSTVQGAGGGGGGGSGNSWFGGGPTNIVNGGAGGLAGGGTGGYGSHNPGGNFLSGQTGITGTAGGGGGGGGGAARDSANQGNQTGPGSGGTGGTGQILIYTA